MHSVLQAHVTWNSPPRILRLASPYVIAVLGDAIQILPLRSSSADTLSQAWQCPGYASCLQLPYACKSALLVLTPGCPCCTSKWQN